jgi:hypothetical protein
MAAGLVLLAAPQNLRVAVLVLLERVFNVALVATGLKAERARLLPGR